MISINTACCRCRPLLCSPPVALCLLCVSQPPLPLRLPCCCVRRCSAAPCAELREARSSRSPLAAFGTMIIHLAYPTSRSTSCVSPFVSVLLCVVCCARTPRVNTKQTGKKSRAEQKVVQATAEGCAKLTCASFPAQPSLHHTRLGGAPLRANGKALGGVHSGSAIIIIIPAVHTAVKVRERERTNLYCC